MFIGITKNEHGVDVAHFECEDCGTEYTITPAPDDVGPGGRWNRCMTPECPSYDPDRDWMLTELGDTSDLDTHQNLYPESDL